MGTSPTPDSRLSSEQKSAICNVTHLEYFLHRDPKKRPQTPETPLPNEYQNRRSFHLDLDEKEQDGEKETTHSFGHLTRVGTD